eukprot:CAMPEP_0181304586 /NCGR_PEP_ID=MMETSP1101-20121128/9236_1 /TAXON_ID=46948 /ORGANISM="Rhodomonas abbreviata, Strain Caron Lab Isolate" /LENGTH=496 /DNA_ID=CAMNT_0023410367 /DNA_START=43 /DNA_END=1533 /DNA_ORIENTATION=+
MVVRNIRKAELVKRGYRDLVHWLENPNHVYIGRNMLFYVPGAEHSKWANPFSVKKYGRDGCLEMYKEHILKNEELRAALPELKGMEMGCWCHPERCHGDVLLELLTNVNPPAEFKEAKSQTSASTNGMLKVAENLSESVAELMPDRAKRPASRDPKFSDESFTKRPKTVNRGAHIIEIEGDLFKSPSTSSLAHCISVDLKMGKGIAKIFRDQFGGIEELRNQGVQVGGVAVLRRPSPPIQEKSGAKAFVYYLITKEKYWQKPTLVSLRSSLQAMAAHMKANDVHALSMPRIGCGLDGLNWPQVHGIISDVFAQEMQASHDGSPPAELGPKICIHSMSHTTHAATTFGAKTKSKESASKPRKSEAEPGLKAADHMLGVRVPTLKGRSDLIQALKKSEGDQDSETTLDVLDRLAEDKGLSMEFIVGIAGKAVKSLRKHSDERVRERAKALILTWKNVVAEKLNNPEAKNEPTGRKLVSQGETAPSSIATSPAAAATKQ